MAQSLREIELKVRAGERLNFDEGVFLWKHPDLLSIGQMANLVREKLHGDVTYYNRNLHLNSTNVCESDCIFCSFARLEEGMPKAYTMTVPQALNWIKERYVEGMTEIHIVNGLNPNLPFNYYLDLLAEIKKNYPALHIKAFTAVEIFYFAEKFGKSYTEIFEELREAGLGSMPGGGAEIFASRARKKLCKEKADAEQWLDVHRTAHSMGIKSNCTMLYGTIETVEERVDHILRLRQLQDETKGFQAFIPLAFHPENNRLGPVGAPTGAEDLRTFAVSRLLLDNVPHLKAYWIMLGVKIAQIAQRFGANDIDGTVTEEKIYHMAGASTPNSLSVPELERIVRDIGRVPVERTTTYEILSHTHQSSVTSEPSLNL